MCLKSGIGGCNLSALHECGVGSINLSDVWSEKYFLLHCLLYLKVKLLFGYLCGSLCKFDLFFIGGIEKQMCYLDIVGFFIAAIEKQMCYLDVVFFGRQFLAHFMLLICFYPPWNHHKIRGFLIFSRGIERDQCHEMGEKPVWAASCNSCCWVFSLMIEF